MSVKVPVLHSLILAAGAAAKNFKVEIFTEEQIVTEAGRLYFVNGNLKFSYLDGEGVLQVATVATGNGLAEALAALTADLQDEITRATAAEAGLQADIDTLTTDLAGEITRATAAETALTTALADEVTRATDAEAALTTAIAYEANRASLSETALQANIDALTANKADISYVDNKVAALGNAFQYVGLATGGVDSASAFDLSTLTTKTAGSYYKVAGLSGTEAWFKVGAAGEPFMANGQDGLLFNNVAGVDIIDATDYEVSGSDDILVTGNMSIGYTLSFTAASLARFTALQDAIDAEETRALAAEQAIADSVTAEQTRAEAAEADLAADLADEVTRASNAETALQTAIADLGSSTADSFGDLKAAINGGRHIYTAATDTKVHTMTHNLGHTDYVVTVVELDVDGTTMINSFVPYEANANEVIAELSVNGKVKIFVTDMSDLV